jgi:hypothetical protein
MIESESAVQEGLRATTTMEANGEASEAQSIEIPVLLRQVDRILHSEELRGSEVLRRLLKFLTDKSISGHDDELKEYIVAIDGLGKPASYDPRHNSAVRIQLGRLRQKLADYYRNEGQSDPVIIDVPKGRFKLTYEFRDGSALSESHGGVAALPIPEPDALSEKRTFGQSLVITPQRTAAIAVALLALAGIAGYKMLKPVKANVAAVPSGANWNADMEELWHPYTAANRPTIVAIEDPLFVELDGKKGVYYRDKTLNTWHDITVSPSVDAVRTALKNHDMAPSRYYTAFGEVDSSFILAKLLGSRVQNLSVLKTSDFSMRELADNNVIFVGMENLFFADQIQAAPIQCPLQPVQEGIRNAQPGPHEPAIFLDEYSTAPTEQGFAYALITHIPGPLGNNDVESFTSNRAAGYVAAVKAFTDANFVHTLVAKLKQVSGGQMPRYYQVLLKVKFTAEEPTEVTYVLAREVRYPGPS